MRTYNLKKPSIPKVAVLATGVGVAVLAGTLGPQAAQAYPSRARDCTQCHGSGAVSGTVRAVPSTTVPAAGGAYTVLVTPPTGSGDTGYWIASSTSAGTTGTSVVSGGGTGTSAATYTANLTAPAAAGTYYYKVWADRGPADSSGVTNFALFSITVSSPPTTVPPTTVPPTTVPPTTVPPTTVPPTTVPPTTVPPTTVPPTTVPPTTVPPTTVPPTTVPPTTVPPTTVPPTTVPPTTVPPTTVPPTTVPPTTVPPTTVPPTTPPVSPARIRSLSPTHGVVGAKVTIRGTGFGKPGVVKFGKVTARASSWTKTTIVVRVPAKAAFTMKLRSAVAPVWYSRPASASVTVTPKGATASNAISFRLDSGKHGEDAGESVRKGLRHGEDSD